MSWTKVFQSHPRRANSIDSRGAPKEKAANNNRNKIGKTKSEDFEDFDVVKLISKAKFPVYLVFCPSNNEYYALKVYNFLNKKIHPYFANEARFFFLNHPNIINIILSQENVAISTDDKEPGSSCLLMEYAPNGDFFDFVRKSKQYIGEKLARTYFRQLIEGIEYLHLNGVWHLDLKLENLLIGKDNQIKIADFDLSYVIGDAEILTKGTQYYRAPELLAQKCKDGSAADIYSAGVILFLLKTGGAIPHSEGSIFQGVDLLELLQINTKLFFSKHCEIQEKESSFFTESFQELFVSMTKKDPRQRATISEIKSSRWYNGPVYTKGELAKKMKLFLSHRT